jgi:hypothetical protein
VGGLGWFDFEKMFFWILLAAIVGKSGGRREKGGGNGGFGEGRRSEGEEALRKRPLAFEGQEGKAFLTCPLSFRR